MRYLFLILLIANIANAQTLAEEAKLRSNDWQNLQNAPDYSCFNWADPVTKDHEWQKNYIYVSKTWALIHKDKNAVLIAQPSSICEEDFLDIADGANCKYWFRTVERDHNFIDIGLKMLAKCPEHLSKARLKAMAKKYYSKSLDLGS